MYCFAKPDILNIAWHSKLFCKIISGLEKEDCLLHCWPDIWRGMQESSQAGQDWLVAFCVYFHATLQYITDQISSIENGLFMLETSGRGTLNTRQACAVESAAMRSGLVVHLVMISTHLDLRENTTCQLYMSNNNIRFFTIDLSAFTIDSPLGMILMDWYLNFRTWTLENFFSSNQLEGSLWTPVHAADALRLLMLYKFGGFYLDLDFVVLSDLRYYNNMVLGNSEWV